jgi:hypothetical protein
MFGQGRGVAGSASKRSADFRSRDMCDCFASDVDQVRTRRTIWPPPYQPAAKGGNKNLKGGTNDSKAQSLQWNSFRK